MFRNNIIGDCPDGLVFTGAHAISAVCNIEVKCPYSVRDVKIGCGSEWHHRPDLDCNNELKKTHDYYHQIQVTTTAAGVECCDFVIWSPRNMTVHRFYRDFWWSLRYVPQLESFYKHHIVRSEEFDECDSDDAAHDTDEEPFEPCEHRHASSPASSTGLVPPRWISATTSSKLSTSTLQEVSLKCNRCGARVISGRKWRINSSTPPSTTYARPASGRCSERRFGVI